MLDLSFMEARTVMPPAYERVDIILVGCGGTGSWIAPHLARLTKVLGDAGKKIFLHFTDHDIVEAANLNRQNFVHAELGCPKANVLAYRYSAALGIPIEARVRKFKAKEFNPQKHDNLYIIVGAVDNAAARKQIAKALDRVLGYPAWWLDCGNGEETGQILFGNVTQAIDLFHAFDVEPWCTALPAPHLQRPDLLIPRPEELVESNLSCEQIALRNSQSLTINHSIASIATNYILRFLTGQLKTFATEVNIAAGVMRSSYVTEEEVRKVANWPVRRIREAVAV